MYWTVLFLYREALNQHLFCLPAWFPLVHWPLTTRHTLAGTPHYRDTSAHEFKKKTENFQFQTGCCIWEVSVFSVCVNSVIVSYWPLEDRRLPTHTDTLSAKCRGQAQQYKVFRKGNHRLMAFHATQSTPTSLVLANYRCCLNPKIHSDYEMFWELLLSAAGGLVITWLEPRPTQQHQHNKYDTWHSKTDMKSVIHEITTPNWHMTQ